VTGILIGHAATQKQQKLDLAESSTGNGMNWTREKLDPILFYAQIDSIVSATSVGGHS
jgi:hypothetical protein